MEQDVVVEIEVVFVGEEVAVGEVDGLEYFAVP